MTRAKESDKASLPVPRVPRTVKKGCISCVHYKPEMKASLYKECADRNYWEDSMPTKIVHSANCAASL